MLQPFYNYRLSDDYFTLAALMRERSMICIVDYSPSNPRCDVAHTIFTEPDRYLVSARGIGYIDAVGLEDFIDQCRAVHLSYLG